MSGKKIDKSVFSTLNPEYISMVVTSCGKALALNFDHRLIKPKGEMWHFEDLYNAKVIVFGEGYDASDWQNSGIDRPSAVKPSIFIQSDFIDSLRSEYELQY